VVLKENRGRYKECIGYVLKEDVGKLSIKTESGDVVEMIKPEIDQLGNWVYHHRNDEEYKIVQYWPIRLKLLDSGYVHMTLNKFKLSDDDKIIV
jgi:hypothetical protein